MGPFKCPDCGVWWAGLEHRCRPTKTAKTTIIEPVLIGGTFQVRCSCVYDANGHRLPQTAICQVHDIRVTYTNTAQFA